MNWRDYLKSIGMTEDQIKAAETALGTDNLSKALEGPIQAKTAAETALAAAKAEKQAFEDFYQNDVLPKVSQTYQDAINWRTRASAAEERLRAAKEYGFLADEGAMPTVPATPTVNQPAAAAVPGSPAVTPAAAAALDPRYVPADKFVSAVDSIPDMLGRLTNMSNEHFSLFGAPLLDVNELIATAKSTKRNVLDVWKEKYKVEDKRKEIETARTQAREKQVGEEAIRKYLSEHGMPFTRPAQPSLASAFTPKSVDDARHPWKGADARKQERKSLMLNAWNKTGPGAPVQ